MTGTLKRTCFVLVGSTRENTKRPVQALNDQKIHELRHTGSRIYTPSILSELSVSRLRSMCSCFLLAFEAFLANLPTDEVVSLLDKNHQNGLQYTYLAFQIKRRSIGIRSLCPQFTRQVFGSTQLTIRILIVGFNTVHGLVEFFWCVWDWRIGCSVVVDTRVDQNAPVATGQRRGCKMIYSASLYVDGIYLRGVVVC